MGTYDNACGAALHNPDFDRGDDIPTQEEKVLMLLEEAQELNDKTEALHEDLKTELLKAVGVFVRPGAKLKSYADPFGHIRVTAGNARGCQSFEVAGTPRIEELRLRHPHLTRLSVEAFPLNDDGRRLSGRAGNSSKGRSNTVTLAFYLAESRGPDDNRSGTDLVVECVRRSALHQPFHTQAQAPTEGAKRP